MLKIRIHDCELQKEDDFIIICDDFSSGVSVDGQYISANYGEGEETFCHYFPLKPWQVFTVSSFSVKKEAECLGSYRNES